MADIRQISAFNWEVLLPFTRGYHQQLYASEISRLVKLPLRTVSRKLAHFQRNKIISYHREGKNKYFHLEKNNAFTAPLLNLLENYKEINFLLNYPLESLLLEELAGEYSIILFGSYAKGLAKPGSDLDIVILSKKNKRINDIISKYNFEVNLHYVDYALLERRLREKQALALEMVKDHIIFGEKERIISLFRLYP